MDFERVKGMNRTEGDLLKPDPAELNKAGIVLKFFDTALSAMKIYPSRNPAIQRNLMQFFDRLNEFLDTYEELRLGIQEFSFTLKKEPVFQDKIKKKSLPFLLFKDGMRELSFYEGLEQEELREFMEILKEASDLPPEESDVVSFLWEKDFINIRYFVIDEFLDLFIGREGKEREYEIDKSELFKGKLGLTEEDREEIEKESEAFSFTLDQEEEGEEESAPVLTSSVRVPFIKEVNLPEIEAIVSQSRQRTYLSELVPLLFEVLYHEERDEEFSSILDALIHSYTDAISHADFTHARLILERMQDLEEAITTTSEERLKFLVRTHDKARSKEAIDLIKKTYLDGRVKDIDSYFQFMQVLGTEAIPIAGAIWKRSADPVAHQKALDFLKEAGKKNVSALLYLVRGSDLSMAKEVISLLEEIVEPGDIYYFEDFVKHPNKEIRLQIIKVLSRAANEEANRILLKFLSDKDEEIRAEAAKSLKYLGDSETFDSVIEMIHKKDFKERNRMEKTALLIFSGRTQKDEAYALLRSLLKKWSLFPVSKQTETRLCAVSALAALANPEAEEILKEGTRFYNRTVRRACELQLKERASRAKFDETKEYSGGTD
jgi:hypothetical protein